MLVPFEIEKVELHDRPNDAEGDGVFWRAVRFGYEDDLSIHLERWVLAKKTPKGCWVLPEWLEGAEKYREDWRTFAKLVIFDSRRKHVYPTKDEAFDDLKRRNIWWGRFLRRDLDRCERINRILEERGKQ